MRSEGPEIREKVSVALAMAAVWRCFRGCRSLQRSARSEEDMENRRGGAAVGKAVAGRGAIHVGKKDGEEEQMGEARMVTSRRLYLRVLDRRPAFIL